MIGINDKMAKRIVNVLKQKKKVDEKGKTKYCKLKHDNEIMIMQEMMNWLWNTVMMFSMVIWWRSSGFMI